MEEKKGMSPILIILLTILATCLIIFGVWFGIRYVNKVEKPQPGEPEEVSTVVGDEPSGSGEVISDFPKKSDNGVLIATFQEFLTEEKVKTDFKNLKFEKNENTFVYNCQEYVKGRCTKIILSINDSVKIEEKLEYSVDHTTGEYDFYSESILDNSDKNIYKVGNYYVVYDYVYAGADLNYIDIYKGLNKVYENYDVKREYWTNENFVGDNSGIIVQPVIVNGVLHFIEAGDTYGEMKYNTIDLLKDKIEVKLIKKINGYVQER